MKNIRHLGKIFDGNGRIPIFLLDINDNSNVCDSKKLSTL